MARCVNANVSNVYVVWATTAQSLALRAARGRKAGPDTVGECGIAPKLAPLAYVEHHAARPHDERTGQAVGQIDSGGQPAVGRAIRPQIDAERLPELLDALAVGLRLDGDQHDPCRAVLLD